MFARFARVATAVTLVLIAAHPLGAQSCILEYHRADNMWAAFGRPDGNLGAETITLSPGASRVFVTDWKYEKTRNDGTNFYGSHLRTATNRGTIPASVEVVSATMGVSEMLNNLLSETTKLAWNRARVAGKSGATRSYRADLAVVRCPNA